MHYLHIARQRQLVVGHYPLDVAGHHRSLTPELPGHLLLTEPDRIALETDVEPHLPVGRLVDGDLAAGMLKGIGHAASERSESCWPAQG
jgi:hypothetical protein